MTAVFTPMTTARELTSGLRELPEFSAAFSKSPVIVIEGGDSQTTRGDVGHERDSAVVRFPSYHSRNLLGP